jgi:phosphoglycolate phosphatase
MKMESKRYLVLWDVDGTLIANSQSDEDLFVRMVRDVLGPQDRIEHPYRHGKTDRMMVREYVMANGGSPEDVLRAAKLLVALSRERFAAPGERRIERGVIQALDRLATAGNVNAILTGNSRERAELKLISAGVDLGLFDWGASFFGETSDSRTELTEAAAALAAKRGLRPIIVGDTKADGQAAQAAGIEFVGVATGNYTVTELRELPHLTVVEDLESGLAALEGTLV